MNADVARENRELHTLRQGRAAVLALHRPDPYGYCTECVTGEDSVGYLVFGQKSPCPTVEALGGAS